jgi:uncharacterized cupredoxin-like copper-binding protein
MLMQKRSRVLAAVAFGATAILSGCAEDPADVATDDDGRSGVVDVTSNKITGSVREWKVQVSAGKAEAGDVRFAITNYGTIAHEFLVVKTEFDPGQIPLGDNNRFDEELKGIEVIDEIPEWEVNDTGMLKVKLEPGQYELLCNIEGHYAAGMHTSFEVTPGNYTEAPPPGPKPSDTVSNDIDGFVKEWTVFVGNVKAKAGDVNFTVKNDGTIAHEFLVVKTDFEGGEIPLGKDNRFDEEAEGLKVVDEIPEWKPGDTGKLTVKLDPGKYQLLCNIAGHYKAGMWREFEVVG